MPTDTSFSSGFASGGSVLNAREDRRVLEEQNRLDQQNLMREKAVASVAEGLELLQTSAKKQSAAFFTSKGNNDQKGMDTAIAVQTRTAQEIWKSTDAMLKSVGTSEAEIANIKERIRIAASLNNPAAEQRLEETEKTRGAVATATGKQPLELEQIRVKAEEARKTRAIPTNQNINTTNLSPPVERSLQTDILSNEDRIARLGVISKQINANPEFLEFFSKAKSKFLDRLEFAGVPLTEGGEEFLTLQSKFVRNSIENINNYIKEITGAQMSEKEANRLRLAQPDPGEGVFGGDGPTKFKAKLEGAIEAAKLAQARSIYFLNNGIEHDFAGINEPPISITGMKEIVNQRGMEQARIIRASNPDMPAEEVIRRASETVQKQFGMSQ